MVRLGGSWSREYAGTVVERVCVGDVVLGKVDYDFGVDGFSVVGISFSVFTVFEEEIQILGTVVEYSHIYCENYEENGGEDEFCVGRGLFWCGL